MKGKRTEPRKAKGIKRHHSSYVEGSGEFGNFIKGLPGVDKVSLGSVHNHGSKDKISFSLKETIKADAPAGKVVLKWCQTTGCQDIVVIPAQNHWLNNRAFVEALVKACRSEYPDFQVQDIFKVKEIVQPKAESIKPVMPPATIPAEIQSIPKERAAMPIKTPTRIAVSQRADEVYHQVKGKAVQESGGLIFTGSLSSVLNRPQCTVWGRQLVKLGAVKMLNKGSWLFPEEVELEIKPFKRGFQQPKAIALPPVESRSIRRANVLIVIPEKAIMQDERLRNILLDDLLTDEKGELRSSEQLIAIAIAFQSVAKDIEFIEQDRKKSETLFHIAQASLLRKQKAERP